MNTFLPEHTGQESAFEPMYDWQQPTGDSFGVPSAVSFGMSSVRPGYEHEFGLAAASRGPFNGEFPAVQRPFVDEAYRSDSPHSAPPSSGNAPWSASSFPSQDVMYHPDVDISKFNRGSRGSMNSLSLTSMRTPMFPNSAYTPKVGTRPHALSVSTVDQIGEQPWNLIPDRMPFAQDGSGMAIGASFFLRSPTPTKRQRTNQACEKCRERKAKCNGGRPTCQRCAARGHICEYAKERRMRGPNKTGRRGSQADLEDPIDSPGRGAASLDPEGSETNRGDSPASSRPGSRRSSSEDQTEQGSASRPKSASASPEPAPMSGPTAPIALPTLSNGNLSLMQYPMGSSGGRLPGADHQRAIPSESVIRYAQSMPQLGYRHAQSHEYPREGPTGAWNGVDNQAMSGMNVPDGARGDESSTEYPHPDLQTHHYSVSDVSSSSTPITPDRFEYAWPPPSDSQSPQQNTFQFGHEKPQTMLPTLPEFDNESNSLGELRVWSESHSDPMMGSDSQQNTLVQ